MLMLDYKKWVEIETKINKLKIQSLAAGRTNTVVVVVVVVLYSPNTNR